MTATRLVSAEALANELSIHMASGPDDVVGAWCHCDEWDDSMKQAWCDHAAAAIFAALPAAPAEPAWDCPTCGAPAAQSVGGEWVSRWYSLQRMLSDKKPVGLEALQTAAGVLGMRLVDNAEPAPSVMNLMERKVASGESGTLDLSPPAEAGLRAALLRIAGLGTDSPAAMNDPEGFAEGQLRAAIGIAARALAAQEGAGE